MYARVTEWDGVTPEEIDRELAYARAKVVPQVEDIPGMCGMVVLVDREHGRSTSITLYQDKAALEASRDTARTLREMVEQRMDLRQPPVVKEVEVGLAALNATTFGLPLPA
jgi:quinol monooxygenase YgiN